MEGAPSAECRWYSRGVAALQSTRSEKCIPMETSQLQGGLAACYARTEAFHVEEMATSLETTAASPQPQMCAIRKNSEASSHVGMP